MKFEYMNEVLDETGNCHMVVQDRLAYLGISLTSKQSDTIWDAIQSVLEEYCIEDYRNHN